VAISFQRDDHGGHAMPTVTRDRDPGSISNAGGYLHWSRIKTSGVEVLSAGR